MQTVLPALTIISTGEIQGGTTAFQLPDIPCAMVKVKAAVDNTGNVYLGGSSSVTVADGTTDTTTGYQLDAGNETDWLPLDNLNKLYAVCDNNADDMTYIALL